MKYELHVIKDCALWRYGGRTAKLGTYRSMTGARRALHERVRTHSLCGSAYEIHEVAA